MDYRYNPHAWGDQTRDRRDNQSRKQTHSSYCSGISKRIRNKRIRQARTGQDLARSLRDRTLYDGFGW